MTCFPREAWPPEALGFDPARLGATRSRLDELAAGEPYRVLIVRHGCAAAEWNSGMGREPRVRLRSASKSAYTCLLGIALEEGRLPSLDAKVVEHYPEMMEVRDGEGPKPGRYAHPHNREITFRQLAGNTSGYLKPGEPPGRFFHYQTFGMNILSNARATIYGLFDSADPDRLPGCARLLADRIRDPIGGTWEHVYDDFAYPPGAGLKRGVYGHGLQIVANAHEAARLGQLWLNRGVWEGTQVVPAWYLEEATRTNRDILANEDESRWSYGLGFWVNDHGRLWPALPRDLFGARGAGVHYVWVSPALDLVVTLCPGPWGHLEHEAERRSREQAVLGMIIDALRD